jgi:hypothetical protein
MYVGRIDEHPPPGVGAIARKGKLLKGDLVAAYVEDVWILAEIINVFYILHII